MDTTGKSRPPGRPPSREYEEVAAALKLLAITFPSATASSLRKRLHELKIDTTYSTRRLRALWAEARKGYASPDPGTPEMWAPLLPVAPGAREKLVRCDMLSKLYLKRTLTAREATWIGQIFPAVHDLDDFFLWILGREYAARELVATRTGSTPHTPQADDIDQLLAIHPWRSEADSTLLRIAVNNRTFSPRPPIITALAESPHLPGSLVAWLYHVLEGRTDAATKFSSNTFNWLNLCLWRIDPASLDDDLREALEREVWDA